MRKNCNDCLKNKQKTHDQNDRAHSIVGPPSFFHHLDHCRHVKNCVECESHDKRCIQSAFAHVVRRDEGKCDKGNSCENCNYIDKYGAYCIGPTLDPYRRTEVFQEAQVGYDIYGHDNHDVVRITCESERGGNKVQELQVMNDIGELIAKVPEDCDKRNKLQKFQKNMEHRRGVMI